MLFDSFIDALVWSPLVPRKVRRALLRAYGLRIHTSNVMPRCHFGGSDIGIGRESFVNRGCVFDNSASIEIGERVMVGMEVMFTTSSHALGSSERRGMEVTAAPIAVGDGCWIGARATILPGVTIGEGCVIGAGALVREDCEPNSLYAGVPARRIKALD